MPSDTTRQRGPEDHADCAAWLRDEMARMCNTDITVSTEPPLVRGPYTTDNFVCPHGVPHWIEPTGEQIAQWARDGVR